MFLSIFQALSKAKDLRSEFTKENYSNLPNLKF